MFSEFYFICKEIVLFKAISFEITLRKEAKMILNTSEIATAFLASRIEMFFKSKKIACKVPGRAP